MPEEVYQVGSDCWITGRTGLRFLFGEFAIATIRFSCLIAGKHFTEYLGRTTILPEPPDGWRRKAFSVKFPSHPVEQKLSRIKIAQGCIRYVPQGYKRFYIVMDGSFDEYLGKFSSKSRSTLKRKVRKFEEFCGGALECREFREKEEMATFHELAREVSRKTYQERLLDSGLPSKEAFADEVSGAARCRAYILCHQGRPIAYMYCPEKRGAVLYDHVGYDPDYHEWSPGTVLLYAALKSLFAEGSFRIFDFTEGEGAHKEFFGNREASCADIFYFRFTPGAVLLVGTHALSRSMSAAVVVMLRKLGVKDRIKRMLRRSSK